MGKRLTSGINVDRLNQEILDLGVRVRLWKSTLAPNMKSLESMDQDLNDQVSNNMMIDFDCIETVAMFQQQDLTEQFKIQGTFDIDEVFVSFLSGQTLAPYAKVEVLDFKEDFYELIPRQEGQDVDVLKYSACEVIAVFTQTTDAKERYYQGADFVLDQNGNIKWVGAHKPEDRQIYSVYYRFHPTYRAVKAAHRDRFSQYNVRVNTIEAPKITVDGKTYVKLPETWILKRDYLIERRDLLGALLPKNKHYDPNS